MSSLTARDSFRPDNNDTVLELMHAYERETCASDPAYAAAMARGARKAG